MRPHRLITIPPSHYCEKARWALQRQGVAFVEEGHAPVFQMPHALWAGGRRTVPVLVRADGIVHNDSAAILAYADSQVAPERQLDFGPPDAEAQAFEARCNDRLGPHSRRLSYDASLAEPEPMLPYLMPAIPRLERWLLRPMLPLSRIIIRRLMEITPPAVERSRKICEDIFAEASARLQDGRPYLRGERFSSLDLTFCALASVLVIPREYGTPMPELADLPAAWRALAEHFRGLPAGQWVLDVYARERQPQIPVMETRTDAAQ